MQPSTEENAPNEPKNVWDTAMDAVRELAKKKWESQPVHMEIGLENGQIVRLPFRVLQQHATTVQGSKSPAAAQPGEPRAQPTIADLVQRQTRFSHSRNWQVIYFDGVQYMLTPMQAEVIRTLVQARDAGTPDVHEDELLRQSDSNCERLRDLFRRSDVLGKVVVKGELPRYYRLADVE